MSFSAEKSTTFTGRVPSQPAWTVRRTTRPLTKTPSPVKARLTRRFDVEWFDGRYVQDASMVAPALPMFEEAFGAFAHGVLVQTRDGLVAVEDLEPGCEVECSSGDFTRLMWKGAITLVPGAPTMNEEPDRLYRVMADTFGPSRPGQDQTFGPSARKLDRDAKIRAAFGAESALLPVSSLVDGAGVVAVNPVSPTRVYHIACETHETILAAGMEVETYHPGPEAPLSMSEEMMELFMKFFPHLRSVRDFGRLTAPRITTRDLEMM